MTGTDLATVATQLPAHLKKAKAQTHDEFGGGLGAHFPLPFLSVRGKEFRLRKDGQELNTRQRELSVIFVAARHTLSKRYYDKQYTSGSLEAPDCSSRDAAHPDVSDPVHPNCASCPKNQWGSRITESGKQGKACSDYKRVVLWPVGMTEEPLVLDVSATSLKAPKGQKHTVLMLGDYLSQLAKHGMDPTQVVTKVQFTDAEYPQLCFTFERYVTEEEWVRVQELRESDDVKTVIDDDMYEDEGPSKEATTEEKPRRTRKPPAKKKEEPPKDDTPAFPGVATIMKQGDNMIIAQTEEDWQKAWADGFRPQETGQLKKAAAEPEEGNKDSTPDPGEDDILAEVQKLLGS